MSSTQTNSIAQPQQTLHRKPKTVKKLVLKEDNEETQRVPQILQDIAEYLKQHNIKISEAIEGEGRGGSLKDEGSVKNILWGSPYKKHVLDEKARKFGDMTVVDYDGAEYVVNIKTSIGSTDNCFSKAGFVYAFTSLSADKIPKAMNFETMISLIKDNKADIPKRDYYFLCVDKKDSSNVMVRGAKQIKNWVININPSNVLQVNWKKEKTCGPANRTWIEAYEVLINGAKESTFGFFRNLPQEWKEELQSIVILE